MYSRIDDAGDLVDLYHIIHTDAESLNHLNPEAGPIEKIQVCTLSPVKVSTKN